MNKILNFLGIKIQLSDEWKSLLKDIVRMLLIALIFSGVLYLLGRVLDDVCLQVIILLLLASSLGYLLYHYRLKLFLSKQFGQHIGWVLLCFALILLAGLYYLPSGQFKNLSENNNYLIIVASGSFAILLPFTFVQGIDKWTKIPSKYFSPLSIVNLNDLHGAKIPPSDRGIKWVFLDNLPEVPQKKYEFRYFVPQAQNSNQHLAFEDNIAFFFKYHLAFHNNKAKYPIFFKNKAWSFYADENQSKMLDHSFSISSNWINGLRFKTPPDKELGKIPSPFQKKFKWVIIYVKRN